MRKLADGSEGGWCDSPDDANDDHGDERVPNKRPIKEFVGGSGVSGRYLRVVEGRGAMVFFSWQAFLLETEELGDVCPVISTSSEDVSWSGAVGQPPRLSSSSPESTAMHCTTSSLKWMCRVMSDTDAVVGVLAVTVGVGLPD